MSASDHISPRLFHGTGHYFGDNEVIDPSFNKYNVLRSDQVSGAEDYYDGVTFADTSFSRAQSMSSRKAQQKGMLFAPVYEVPSESFTKFSDISRRASMYPDHVNTYVTKEKVKPTRVAGWGINPDAANEDTVFEDTFYAGQEFMLNKKK